MMLPTPTTTTTTTPHKRLLPLLLIGALLVLLEAKPATLRRTQSVIDHQFDFEYRLFYEDGGEPDTALSSLGEAVANDLREYFSTAKAQVEVQEVTSVSRGGCDAEDLDEQVAAKYDNCLKARSTITLTADPDLDESVLERTTLIRVRFFVSNPNAVASLETIYDYPKLVQASALLRLTGQGVAMDDDEQYLFLKAFEEGFRSTLEAAYFEWISARIIGQQAGSDTPELDDQEDYVSSSKDLYNRVEIMMRAQCSGDACTDDNFERWLTKNLQAFAAEEFLSRLYSVGPEDKDMYYDALRSIDIISDPQLVTPLKPPAIIDTTHASPEEAEIPAWVWVIVVAGLAILAFAVVWTCMALAARKGKQMQRKSSQRRASQQQSSSSQQQQQGQRSNSFQESNVAVSSKDAMEEKEVNAPTAPNEPEGPKI